MNLENKNNKGFTLIELLVVIAIIGLLSSIVLASLSSARQKAIDAKIMTEYNQIKTAFELYYSKNGKYPTPPSNNGIPSYCIGGTDCILSGGYPVSANLSAYTNFTEYKSNSKYVINQQRGFIYIPPSNTNTPDDYGTVVFSTNKYGYVDSKVGVWNIVTPY
jgi:prepilin-type N-terminal cleavage/methylation domain-containing protein